MPTKELYYADSMLREFDAVVTACEQAGSNWRIELDQTAFFPEGGGQPGDTGTLSGVRVLDTQKKDDRIWHYTSGAIAVGTAVRGTLDFARRFDFMQQHSAEHLLSGIVFKRFGYDNVGFHMGADAVTVDFNGMIEKETLKELELRLNELIWQDLPIETLFPSERELEQISYRSKKELTGQVRIVRCEGADACACCAMHVTSTGRIGVIKLLSRVGYKKTGTRIQMLAGRQAYEYLNVIQEQNERVSTTLSAKPVGTAEAVARLLERATAAEYDLVGLYQQLAAMLGEQVRGCGDVLVFAPKVPVLQDFCSVIQAACGGHAAVFAGPQEAGGYQYMVCGGSGKDDPVLKELNRTLSGKGGGRDGWMRGSVAAERQAIETYFDGWKTLELHSS